MIDLLSIEPNVISRDLREKIVFIYGEPKSGKTTLASKFPTPILIGFEKGYNAIAGIHAVPINKWTEFKQVLKQLKTEPVKEKFETVIIDTVDIAYDLAEKYICQREGVQSIGDISFGAGYAMVEKEIDECLREIPLLGFALVMISHAEDKTFTDESGQEFNRIVPTLNKRGKKVASRMADVYGYIRNVIDAEGNNKTMMYMRGTPRYEAGSRFKYTPDYIELSYQNLVNAIADAIEKQEKEDGAVVVDKKENIYEERPEVDFETLMTEVQEIITELMKNSEKNAIKIVDIIEKHLGKGKKLNQATKEQADIVVLIFDDLKDLQ